MIAWRYKWWQYRKKLLNNFDRTLTYWFKDAVYLICQFSHKSPRTHNPAALAYENLISQLTTLSLDWQVMIH
jgi:hypothetical protein